MATALSSSRPGIFLLHYLSLRSVVSPEDQEAGRKRYCGVARADNVLGIGCDENVRRYLGADEEGNRRKSTSVNMAIRDTIDRNRAAFPLLNAGIVIVAKSVDVDDNSKTARLRYPSIINGAQTIGVLQDYFRDRPDDTEFPSVNFEVLITDDDELIADISIARNFQNRVEALSIYGRRGLLEDLEAAMKKRDPSVKLRKSETDFGDEYLDTVKLIQVITAAAPTKIRLPSADQRKERTPETIYRVYAYRHRSRCLRDFAKIMEEPEKWPEAREYFLDIAVDAWELYKRLKCEQYFSVLKMVKGIEEKSSARKIVAPDGVPDGLVFPMLSALSRFARPGRTGWRLEIPKGFPWNTLFEQARIHVTTTADHNPNKMGKDADCYMALHGAIEMYFAVVGSR